MCKIVLPALLVLASVAAFAAPATPTPAVEHVSALVDGRTGVPVKVKKDGFITTKATFKPPVEIQIEAKTDSTNLRLGYAADQLIFNWERDKNQLRVDGGPANGHHKYGAGLIPTNKYVLIRWLVTPAKQSVFVDGQLRFEHSGDYSQIEKPITIYSAAGSEVSVKSIKVKQLPVENQ